MDQIATLVRELFPGAPMPLRRVALYAAAALLVTGLVRPDLYRAGPGAWLEGYSVLSLDLAMTRAFCDTPSAVSSLVSVTTEVRDHPELGRIPARELAAERAGSLERFCQTATEPRVNNENSLMWLDAWLWRLRPDLSIDGLGELLHGLRVAGVLVVSALLLVHGYGVIVATVSWLWALILLHELRSYVHHGYPFLLVLLLVTAAVYATIGRFGWMRSAPGVAITAVVVGAWTAFAVNMRTSHLPIYVAFAIALFALDESRLRGVPGRRRVQRLAIAAVLCISGYAAFQFVAITRHLPPTATTLSHHTILHSTVIALGVPESDLSRREGITWSDGAANAIALRQQPGVAYLSVDYERALLNYYRALWRDHTSEMLDVYLLKGRTAGKNMLMALRARSGTQGLIIRWILGPLDLLPNGLWLLALYLLIAVAALFVAWHRSGPAALLAYLAIAAACVHIESTVIMSYYVVNYQSFLAFFCVFLTVAAPAAAVGTVWDWFGRPNGAARDEIVIARHEPGVP